jgi:ERCC4-related helicase
MLRKNVLHKARNKMSVFVDIIREIGEEKLKYCFVYSASGKRYDYEKDENEQYDIEILKQMQAITKATFPSVRCNSYTSNDNKELRRQKLDAFASGMIDVLFAKNCLDEGVDVPRAEYGIFTSSTGNPRQFVQRRGRLLRTHPDKRFAYIYDMIVSPNFHSLQYDQKWWKMEKSLVSGEMRRVANFACLADNYYTGAINSLQDLLDFYQIDLDGMVLIEDENNK